MNKISDNKTLERIKQLCKLKGWSVYKLAKESDISYSSLNNIFIRNTYPTVPTLEKICKGFGISLSEFFEEGFPTDYLLRQTILTPDEYDLLETYRNVSANDKKYIIAYAQGIAKII